MLMFCLRSRAVGRPGSRRSARQMVALCPASGSRGLTLQRLAYRVAGASPRLALRSCHRWPLPISEDAWRPIERMVRDLLELPTGDVLWHLPPADQPQVKFGALFLRPDGHPQTFARVLLGAELPTVIPRTTEGGRSKVRWPTRIAALSINGLAIEVTTSAPAGLHSPVNIGVEALMDLCADVADALRTDNRPAGVPSHWVPMHGDLAHWNLRRYRTGEIYLLDWEVSGWGPKHADLTRFIMTAPTNASIAAQLPPGIRAELSEAASFWASRFCREPAPQETGWVQRAHSQQASALAGLL